MVNQLQRLGLPPNASPEQRRLALDLAAVIISWEQRRRASTAPVTPVPPVRLQLHLSSIPERRVGEGCTKQ